MKRASKLSLLLAALPILISASCQPQQTPASPRKAGVVARPRQASDPAQAVKPAAASAEEDLSQPDPAVLEAEQAKILGPWRITEFLLDGEVPPPAIRLSGTWEFTATTVGYYPGQPFGTWSIDPSKEPKHFVFQPDRSHPRLGLYELNGDELTILYNTGDTFRPSRLKPGYGTAYFKFRRADPLPPSVESTPDEPAAEGQPKGED